MNKDVTLTYDDLRNDFTKEYRKYLANLNYLLINVRDIDPELREIIIKDDEQFDNFLSIDFLLTKYKSDCITKDN